MQQRRGRSRWWPLKKSWLAAAETWSTTTPAASPRLRPLCAASRWGPPSPPLVPFFDFPSPRPFFPSGACYALCPPPPPAPPAPRSGSPPMPGPRKQTLPLSLPPPPPFPPTPCLHHPHHPPGTYVCKLQQHGRTGRELKGDSADHDLTIHTNCAD